MKKVLTSEQTQFLNDLTLQYGDMLTKYAYRFFGYQPNKLEIAQDAVQETFLKAVQEVETLMEHPNIAAWLKVSLKYTLFNTNVLWAAGQSYSGKEFCNCSAQPGKSNYEDAVDILPSRYRLVLDPSGPLATGCNGSGSFSVFDTILGK